MMTNSENQVSPPVTAPEPAQAPPSRRGVIAGAALAVVLLVALFDAAAETLWSGSPLRWWVAPPIVVFVAAVLGLWRPGGALLRRVGPASAAATLAAGLLALLGITAWLPGGLDNGVRMAGQSTSAVLAVLTCAAVVVAAVALMRALAPLPRTARLVSAFVVAVCASYAVASLALGLYERTPYVFLFHGAASWQRMPSFLQGAWLGGLVLVPLGALAALFTSVTRRSAALVGRVTNPMFLVLATGPVFAATLLVGAAGVPSPGSMSTTASPQSAPTPFAVADSVASLSSDERRQAYEAEVAELHERTARLESYLDGFPKSFTDLDALAQELPTPQAAFDYLRDRIAFEPYPGVMKGAKGTLVTRGGNALDRSLLLAAVLTQHGVAVRIAHGRLSPPQVASLLAQVAASPGATERMLASLAARPDAVTLTPHQQGVADAVMVRAASVASTMTRALDDTRPLIQAALEPGGVPRSGEARARVLTSAAEHYWVQATIDGQTVDLDPSLATTAFGARVVDAADAFDPGDVPGQLYQRLSIRLLGERVQGGRIVAEPVLEAEFAAEALVGENIRLGMGPESSAVDERTCRAILLVGDRRTESRPIALKGLGRLVVEVTSRGPDLPDASYRRVVMDRLEPAADGFRIQPALAADDVVRSLLVQAWDGTVSVGTSHVAFVLRSILTTIKAQEAMEVKARAQVYLGEDFGPGDLPAPTVPKELVAFYLSSELARFELGRRGGKHLGSYYERPRIAFVRHGFLVGDWAQPAGEHRFAEGIDLLNAPFQFIGRLDEAALMAVEAGIVDTALERATAGGDASFNTIPLFAEAAAQKVQVVTLRPAQTGALDRVEVPAAIKAALGEELSRGHTLLAPTRLVTQNGVRTFGWWSIDPETGFTLGQMELGGAQGMVEVTKMHERIEKWTEIFAKFYGGLLKCYMEALGDNLGAMETLKTHHLKHGAPGESPMPEPDKLAECVIKQACDTIADLLAEAAIAPAFAKEADAAIKPLQKIIVEWMGERAAKFAQDQVKNKVAKACEQRMGAGGK
jgi:hypothetical protein